jgi:hypothetical protein
MSIVLLSLGLNRSRKETRLIKTVYFDEPSVNLIQIKKNPNIP